MDIIGRILESLSFHRVKSNVILRGGTTTVQEKHYSWPTSMLTKKHLVGVAASALLFGMFGLFIGNWAVAFAGVPYTAPFSDLATGTTPVPMLDVFRPLGLEPEIVGLSNDAVLVLPPVPASITIGGIVIDLGNYSVAEVFGYGGAVIGTLIGVYYAIRIGYEQRQDSAQGDNQIASNE